MPKSAASGAAQEAALEATRLLGKWAKLSQGHMLFAAGCSCGAGPGNVRLEDFEQQILDYLDAKYRAAGDAAVFELLRERAGYRSGESGSVVALLRSIAAPSPNSRPSGSLALLVDLGRSLESFEELHRGR
jgi:hypothetical protein